MIVGIQKLSVKRSRLPGLRRIIPTAPPCMTLNDLTLRPVAPSQTTTLPVADPGASGAEQSVLPPTSVARTTSVGVSMPRVIEAPLSACVAPPAAASSSVVRKWRLDVEAPTVFTQGPPWSAVPAPGPALPADALTVMPAA